MKQRIEGTLHRAAADVSIADDESRAIKLSFSSEEPYLRSSFFDEPWLEVLGHDEAEVDLARLNNGAPVLYNHDRSNRENRLGVVSRAWLENGRGYAEIRLSKRASVDEIWQDVKDGVLTNVSVGYQILERTLTKQNEDGPNEYRVNSWLPMEVSLVDIPADASVGIGRTADDIAYRVVDIENTLNVKEVKTMSEETTSPDVTVDNVKRADIQAAMTTALEQETARRNEIKEVFKPFLTTQRDIMDECLDDVSVTVDAARARLLSEMGKGSFSVSGTARIEVGEGSNEKFTKAAEQTLLSRVGLDKVDPQNEYRSFSLTEFARRFLEINHVSTRGLDKMALVGRAFTTSDFPLLLASTAEKSMLKGYTEAPESFGLWTSVGNLADFKVSDRSSLSEFSDLAEVKESGEYQHGSMSDFREQIQLATYGKMFNISRQAIINDDLNAFSAIPRKMGRAAARKVGDLAYGVLTANAAMSDAVALFNTASHANAVESGGGAPTAATVGAGRTAMRKQTDSTGNAYLNITPSFLIGPAALEDTMLVLMASETDPSKTNSKVPNPVRNMSTVVTDARLDTASATAWYMSANPAMFDTVEIGYLDGNPNPVVEQQDGWNVDGIEFKVRIDAAAKALDWRTMYYNVGA
ncbi:MAG: HK97 family phage prohead protease [Rhodospirillaceae bacterium]|nr:HK97 family phage prohead protease [Rhodospirillaceae bacterium]